MKRLFALLLCLMLLPIAALAETQIVTITVTGDTLLGSNKRTSDKDYAFQRYIEKYGYEYPFANLLSLTANDDITLVNLECVLYTPKELSTSRLVFNGPPDYAKILTAGSVEVANLANNHIGNYGRPGYESTVAALEAEGVAYCGDTEFGRELCWFDFPNDVRVGFIGLLPLYCKDNRPKVQQDFQKLRDAGCDVIIASIHCGVEKNPTHSQMTDTYRKLAMAYGAHIVVGTHPHVPQGLWVEDGVTTFHSLGNFSFGGNTGVDEDFYSYQSVVGQIDLHFEDGVYVGHQVTLWPIHTSGTYPVSDYQPVLVQGEEAQAIMKKIQKDTRFTLNPYIDGQGAVQDFVPWPAE